MPSTGHLKEKDKLLINGWIRTKILTCTQLSNTKKMNKDVIYLISLWYFEDEIHYVKQHHFDQDQYNHFAFSVTNILS